MTTPRPPSPLPALLTVSEVAELLHVSRRTVWQLVASNRVQAVRLGARTTRFERDAVERLLAASRTNTAS